jgi:uncharacterized protein YjiK
VSHAIARLDAAPAGRDRGAGGSGYDRRAEVSPRRLLSAVALVTLLTAGCDQEPLQPDVEGARPPVAGAELRLVRVIESAELDMAAPAGVVYSPRAGQLLVTTTLPGSTADAGIDVHLMTPAEQRAGTVRVPAGVTDPVNIAFDGEANRLLLLESVSSELIVIHARPDGTLDPGTLERIDVRSFGVRDPRGLAVDPAGARLFVLDAAGPRIVSVEPDVRSGFARSAVSEIDLSDAGLGHARGLAFDPGRRRLHVLDPEGLALYEVTETGQVARVRSLAGLGLVNPQGMTFAPSGDSTDDPSEMSLYIADSGVSGGGVPGVNGQITELSLAVGTAAPPAVEAGLLVQAIDTWQFSPASPDPAGIAYLGHLGDFLISDSEVNEMTIFTGVNLFRMRATGELAATLTTTSFSDEPTGITWNPADHHLFISDDTGQKRVYEVDPGPDGLYGTADDVVTSFRTDAYGSSDPEGVTYDSSDGVLFVVDGVNREVYRVAPGPNGLFDGTDDDVTHFDTSVFGLEDPEGIAWDSDTGNLYLVGKPSNLVFHVTTTGMLLRTIDISSASPRKPAGLAYAPSSVNPGEMSLWLVARGVDNGSNPNENDGMTYEIALPSFSGDLPPTVTITGPADGSAYTEGTSIAFTVTASDLEDGDLTEAVAWTSSRDGSIGAGGSFSTSALSTGAHTITASVTDVGGNQASDEIAITVNPEGLVSVYVRVASGSDDAEESATGSVSRTSSDLELVHDGSDQTVGLRFNGVSIPPGAIITGATIQFQADEAHSGATSLTIQGEATDNAATFSGTSGDISTRARTPSSVSWSPAPWPTVGEAGPDQRTPDIASVVQEIVSRPGWASGNALSILITGTGKRTAESYDGLSGAAPLLYVGYTVDPDLNHAPTANDVAVSGVPIVGEELTGSYGYDDLDGDSEAGSEYRWLRDGAPITGATGTSYTLVTEDEGALIAFEVTPGAATGVSPGLAVQSIGLGPVAGSGGGASTVEVRVAASTDDAEEKATGGMRLASSDLELVFDGGDQTVGMRFNAVTVPRGATITNATIQFQVDEVHSEATSLLIQGEAADDAATFAGTKLNISSRGRTASAVPWTPVPWTTKGQAGPDQQTPDIGGIIQEIVNRTGWTSGNSVVLIITGTGVRTAEAYDGVPGAAPLLHVEYVLAPS